MTIIVGANNKGKTSLVRDIIQGKSCPMRIIHSGSGKDTVQNLLGEMQ